MDGLSSAIDSIVSAFSILFSFFPPAWASIILVSIGVYITYVVIKVILDIIGIFF